MNIVEMYKCLVLVCFYLFHFFGKSSTILVPDHDPPKGAYTAGIKTTNWKPFGSSPVTPNPAGHYVVTKTQETQRIYPVYNAQSQNQRPGSEQNILQTQSHTGININEIPRNNKTIYKRKVEYKSVEVYEKCPPGETGQFVYALSCNQYLNCWKGRGTPQNCAPGTLFNPEALECDYPEKVACVTGQSRNSLRVAKSVKQVDCPKGFSGLIPNYTDCSKFINCNDGNSMPMDCPPGTLFDTSKNICDHPNKCTCFDGHSGTEVRVQEVHEGQQIGGSSGPNQGCNLHSGDCGSQSSANQQFHQTQVGYSHREGGNTGPQQSGSGFRLHPGSGVESQGNSQQSLSSVTYDRSNCNPQFQNCGTNQESGSTPGDQRFYQTHYGSHREGQISSPQQGNPVFQIYPGSGVPVQGNSQQSFSVTFNRTNCNPQYQNCSPIRGSAGIPSGATSGDQQIYQTHYGSHREGQGTFSQQSGPGFQIHQGAGVGAQGNSQQSFSMTSHNRTNCNPQYQNCGPIQGSTGNTFGTTGEQQIYHYGSHREGQGVNPQQSVSGFQIYPGAGAGGQGNSQQSFSVTSYNRTNCNPQYQNCGSISPVVGYRQTTSHTQSVHRGTLGDNQYPSNGQEYSSHSQDSSDIRPSTFDRGSTGYVGCNPGTQKCGQPPTYIHGQPNDQIHTCQPGDHNCGGSIPVQVGQSSGYGQTTVDTFGSGSSCNPLLHNCRPIPPQDGRGHDSSYHHTSTYRQNCMPCNLDNGQAPNGNCCGQSTTEANTRNVGRNCDPGSSKCGQNVGRVGVQYQYTDQILCDPRTQNCGQSSQSGSTRFSCDLSSPNCGQNNDQQRITVYTHSTSGKSQIKYNHGSTTGQNYNKICNVNDRNCQSHSIVAKDVRYPSEAKCPHDFQGITKHPFDCGKFLNCANGQTFIQDCAAGTLFNQKLGNCDFPYNVECENSSGLVDNPGSSVNEDWVREYEEHIRQFGQNSGHGNIRTTTGSVRNQGDKVITDINRGEVGVVSRPTHEASTARPSKFDDVDLFDPKNVPKPSSTPRSIWPPPYPVTNQVDYEFDYEDGEPVTLEPEDVVHAEEKNSPECDDTDFHCSADLCITQTMVCDGHRDCADGKDELLCEEYIARFSVHKDSQLVVMEKQRWINASYATCAMLCIQTTKFTCRSFNYRKIDRTCFLSDQNIGLSGALRNYNRTDYYELRAGTVDCSDQRKYFECYNKKCIMKDQVCDGTDDCGDRQDEKNCKAEEFGYSIKLVGSEKRNEGRVEVTAFGRTGYICDDHFGITDANVVCRELGFAMGAVEVKGQSYFAKDLKEKDTQYMMDDTECLGNETTLLDCDFSGWGVHNCGDQEIAGVVCKTPEENCKKEHWKCASTKECVPFDFLCDGINDCSDNSDESDHQCEAPTEIRLVNGSNPSEGRLEIKHHGVWGTVCDDDFNEDAAKVACRQLGYKGRVIVKKEGYFGAGVGPIWLDQVSCYGNESTLEKCSHWNWGEHNCEHTEDVGVVCTDEMNAVEVQRSSKLPLRYEAGLPKSCGYRKDSQFLQNDLIHARVIAGSVAKEGEYPWQAALKVRVKDKSAHWCGAVIVSSKWVLTAAHCLQGYAKGAYVVVAGQYDADAASGAVQRKFIDEFFVHERFRQGHKMGNDVALIKVKGEGFVLDDAVQPICLPDKDADYERALNCTISGFGSVKSGTSTYSHKLMAAWIPVHSKEICKMPHIYGDSIVDGMFCAGFLDGGVDACDGDSGGPLACLDQGVFTLYGLTSWGQHCGYANKPGVYVKVADYKSWIEDTIEKHSQ